MAANRFATLIHRKTNRITLVLVYAFLEWTLIFFILLNSLFSYLILRFADYFGLKRPCLLCSRLDRFFDPSGKSPSHRDLLCHDHALEISTPPSKPLIESKGSDESFDVFPKELMEPDLRDKSYNSFTANLIGDDVQVHNGRLFTERSRSIFVLEEHIGSVPLIDSQERRREQETEEKKDVDDEETEETEEKVIDDEETEEKEDVIDDDDEFSCFVSSFDCNREVVVTEKEEENRVDLDKEVDVTDDKTPPATNLEFYIDDQDCHLIPVEEFYKPSEEVREISDVNGDFILDFGAEPDFSAAVAEDEDARLSSDEVSPFSSPGESKHEEVAETTQGDLLTSVCPDQQQPEPDFAVMAAEGEVKDLELSSDEVSMFPSPGESEPENAKTTQSDLLMFGCPDQQQSEPDVAATATVEKDVGLPSDEISAVPLPGESKQDEAETKQDSPTDDELLQTQTDDEETDADVSIGTEIPDHEQIGDDQSHQLIPEDDDDHGNDTLEFRTVDIETRRPILNANKELLLLETSRSIMFQLDRTEPEPEHALESAERSSSLTVDKLKSELEEERKALNALYEELEEERSASATAANETMAMINRLHEEKAAMQMEALQYQRMMEEQSEFDQEALQLLNEVIVKREKEIAELEKELEVCRKRLEEYEAKERMGMMRMRRMRDSSVDSYRNNGDSDENNGELGHKNVEGESEMENTPVDVVLRLDECLDDYEGERLSILGRLKFLEEKLTALNDEEDEEAKTFESNGNINGNGHLTNGKHRVLKSKRLLPLFDAVDGEIGNGEEHYENGVDESEKGETVNVEEEVDELYERLEALEADREFLRHCVGSLKKGDKGVHLLHEILQHLRDLKNIDLIRVRENEDMSF